MLRYLVCGVILTTAAAAGAHEQDDLVLLQSRAQTFTKGFFDEVYWMGSSDVLSAFWQTDISAVEKVWMGSSDAFTAFGSPMTSDKGTNLVGFGFQKCGTTFAAKVLHRPRLQSNGTKVSGAKELHYLLTGKPGLCDQSSVASPTGETLMVKKCEDCEIDESVRGEKTYELYIQDCFKGQYPKKGDMVLDFTPAYGQTDQVEDFLNVVTKIDRQSAYYNTEFRFLVLLRDPVERAVSHINMKRTNRKFQQNVPSAGSSDDALDAKLLEKLQARSTGHNAEFIDTGEYVEVLTKMLSAFPEERVLMVNAAHLDNHVVWERIFAHIGMEMPPGDELASRLTMSSEEYRAGQNSRLKNRYRPSAEVVKELTEYYKPFNAKLWKLLRVSAWW